MCSCSASTDNIARGAIKILRSYTRYEYVVVNAHWCGGHEWYGHVGRVRQEPYRGKGIYIVHQNPIYSPADRIFTASPTRYSPTKPSPSDIYYCLDPCSIMF